ncbi:hypothetical protein FB451DRAFT_1560798 [Mycena latifolia]|nr:hypothetical protein FB451DRAFT_1560798 [Mycena latifolia]
MTPAPRPTCGGHTTHNNPLDLAKTRAPPLFILCFVPRSACTNGLGVCCPDARGASALLQAFHAGHIEYVKRDAPVSSMRAKLDKPALRVSLFLTPRPACTNPRASLLPTDRVFMRRPHAYVSGAIVLQAVRIMRYARTPRPHGIFPYRHSISFHTSTTFLGPIHAFLYFTLGPHIPDFRSIFLSTSPELRSSTTHVSQP